MTGIFRPIKTWTICQSGGFARKGHISCQKLMTTPLGCSCTNQMKNMPNKKRAVKRSKRNRSFASSFANHAEIESIREIQSLPAYENETNPGETQTIIDQASW
jgi:hypothetical protein